MAVDPQIPDPLEPPPEKPDARPARPAGRAAQWQTAGSRAKASGKNTALIVTALLFMAVAGGLVALFFLPAAPYEPYLISVPVIEYTDAALPPNPWAERDAELLCGVYPNGSDNTRKNAQAYVPFKQKLDDVARLAEQWKTLQNRPGDFNPDRPLVLHVCAHAATDKGTLYLLPSDARAGDPLTWVRVEDVLRAMEDCPAANKLLVLDIARPTVNPFTGPLSDDTADRLHELLARKYKAKDGADRLPCPVLTACSPGETSLVVPEARVSALAFYLAEGLRGAADGYNSGSGQREKDERVMLQEVAAFVSARVQRWAAQTAGVTQTPVLHTRGLGAVDFPLKLGRPEPADDPAPGKLEYAGFEAPARWKDRDALSPAAVRAAGAELARWEAVLVRADQVYAATADPKAANDAIVPELGRRVQQAAAVAVPRPRYHSWAGAAAAFEAPTPAEPVKKFLDARDEYLAAEAAPATGTPDPKAGERRAKFDQAAAAAGPEVAALGVWRWALDAARPGRREVPPRVYQAAAEAARDVVRDPAAFYTEAVLLQAIAQAERNSRAFRNPATGPVKAQLLRTEAAAAAALLQAPDGFLWAGDLIDKADKARQAEEAKFFAGPDEGEYEGIRRRLADAERQFDEARERMRAAARARDVAADALRVLSATAYAAAEFDVPSADGAGGWGELADATRVLADQVCQAPKPAGEVPTAELTARTERVASRLAAFQGRWSPEAVKRRTEPGQIDRDGLRQLAADLTVPLLTADDRKRVWDALRRKLGEAHDKTRNELDKPENESETTRTKPAGTPRPQPQHPDRRTRVAVKLLALAGYAGARELEGKVEAARAASRSDGAWEGVAAELRAAWGRKLPGQIAAHAAAGEWARADRAARVFPPGVVVPDGARAGSEKAAAAELRRAEADAFRDWLRGHYGAYGAIRKAVPGAAESYRKAADETGPRAAD